MTQVLSHVMVWRGAPAYLRSDNGSEFTATAVLDWLREQQVGPAFIAPGRPWHNGYIEGFHSRFRDECLNREWSQSSTEAAQLIEVWRAAAVQYRATAQQPGLPDTSSGRCRGHSPLRPPRGTLTRLGINFGGRSP